MPALPPFLEIELPLSVALQAKGGSSFSTWVQITESGFEQRNVNWATARGKWNVGYPTRKQSEMATLIAFFRIVHGRGYGFRMRDWSDYQAVAQACSPAEGTGAEHNFQLVKLYSAGGYTTSRTIQKPVTAAVKDAAGSNVAETVKIYLDDALQSSGYTVSAATGIVNFTSAPGNGVDVTADFDFDLPVRFDTDEMKIAVVLAPEQGPNGEGLYSWPDLSVIELKLRAA